MVVVTRFRLNGQVDKTANTREKRPQDLSSDMPFALSWRLRLRHQSLLGNLGLCDGGFPYRLLVDEIWRFDCRFVVVLVVIWCCCMGSVGRLDGRLDIPSMEVAGNVVG